MPLLSTGVSPGAPVKLLNETWYRVHCGGSVRSVVADRLSTPWSMRKLIAPAGVSPLSQNSTPWNSEASRQDNSNATPPPHISALGLLALTAIALPSAPATHSRAYPPVPSAYSVKAALTISPSDAMGKGPN